MDFLHTVVMALRKSRQKEGNLSQNGESAISWIIAKEVHSSEICEIPILYTPSSKEGKKISLICKASAH